MAIGMPSSRPTVALPSFYLPFDAVFGSGLCGDLRSPGMCTSFHTVIASLGTSHQLRKCTSDHRMNMLEIGIASESFGRLMGCAFHPPHFL